MNNSKSLKIDPLPVHISVRCRINQFVEYHTGKTRSGEQMEVPQDAHDDPMGFVKNSALKPFEWKSNIFSFFANVLILSSSLSKGIGLGLGSVAGFLIFQSESWL